MRDQCDSKVISNDGVHCVITISINGYSLGNDAFNLGKYYRSRSVNRVGPKPVAHITLEHFVNTWFITQLAHKPDSAATMPARISVVPPSLFTAKFHVFATLSNNSPQGADSLCCYDARENLVYSGDSFDGSFSRRVSTMGMPPYNAPKAVPSLSSWTHDGMPYFFCCVWGDHCDYYQEMRPTRDCRWYEPVRPGKI